MHDVGTQALDNCASAPTPRLQASRKCPACACGDSDEGSTILELRHRLGGTGRTRCDDNDVYASLDELRNEPARRHLWSADRLLPGCREVGDHRDAERISVLQADGGAEAQAAPKEWPIQKRST